MKRVIQAAFIAAALAAPAFAPVAATADVSVRFDSGSVAYGYNDGYWDRSHAWHAWPDASAQREWREHNTTHYYNWKHDRDRDMGWHEDHWWEHH